MDRIWIDGGKFPIDHAGYATKREPGSCLLGPTLETLTGESRLDPGPVDTDLGEALGENVGHVAITASGIGDPPECTDAEFPRSVHAEPSAPVDVAN